jgi:hypothetical protein
MESANGTVKVECVYDLRRFGYFSQYLAHDVRREWKYCEFWCIWAVMKIRARHPAASVRDVHLDFTRVI